MRRNLWNSVLVYVILSLWESHCPTDYTSSTHNYLVYFVQGLVFQLQVLMMFSYFHCPHCTACLYQLICPPDFRTTMELSIVCAQPPLLETEQG